MMFIFPVHFFWLNAIIMKPVWGNQIPTVLPHILLPNYKIGANEKSLFHGNQILNPEN